MKFYRYLLLLPLAAMLGACSDDPVIPGADYEYVDEQLAGNGGDYRGFYVLNEGAMGKNKCSLDWFDYPGHYYVRNIYSERNPEQVMELGDTGNDMAIHDGRLYIVVTGSHKVEVLDAYTATRIGQVDISSPRRIAFDDTHAYVTSTVGGAGDRGSVVRFKLSDLSLDGTVGVGINPEGLAMHDGRLFVANSYNYTTGEFDSTVSVVDPSTMQVSYAVDTRAVNLQHIVADSFGTLWVSSRGNYYDLAPCLVRLAKGDDDRYEPVETLDTAVDNLVMKGNKIYYYVTVYDASFNPTTSMGMVDFTATTAEASPLAVDITGIQALYSITLNPSTGEFYLTDAKNYASSGQLRCYSSDWNLLWTVNTGDIPGHITFLKK